MLIQFTVGNYLSFKDKVTLSMEATSIKEHPENVFVSPDGRYRLLKSVAIYGANGSGKSNLMRAMKKMKAMIADGFKLASNANLDIVPFKLNNETEQSPSFFEILFLTDGVRYRYGFEADNNQVHTEWLFESKKKIEKPLFLREKNQVEIFTAFKEGKGLEGKTSANKLFLSVVDQFNGKISMQIITCLSANSHYFSAFDLEEEFYKKISRQFLSYPNIKKQALNFYNNVKLGFEDFKLSSNSNSRQKLLSGEPIIPDTVHDIKTKHIKYDNENNIVGEVLFDLHSEESKGTNKMFDCVVIILNVLDGGYQLGLDELDASLHPLMTLAVTKLFNSTENNPKNAQLIFTTHDTNLLSKGGFRRDQIYFVEKDNYEASHLYSLAEFKEDGKKIRNDRSFEEDYIQGRYGAIPFIGDFSKLLSNGR